MTTVRYVSDAWTKCDDPAILRYDADYHDREAAILTERAAELQRRAVGYSVTAEAIRGRAEQLERGT